MTDRHEIRERLERLLARWEMLPSFRDARDEIRAILAGWPAPPAAEAGAAAASADVAEAIEALIEKAHEMVPILDDSEACNALLMLDQGLAGLLSRLPASAAASEPPPAAGPREQPAATYESERAALIAEVGDCCRGSDPLCAAECLVERAVRKREQPATVGCLDCGAPYAEDGWCDVVIPDAEWNALMPDGGILCFRCMTRRLVRAGRSDVPVIVTSGPYAHDPERWRLIGWEHGHKVGRQEREQPAAGADADVEALVRTGRAVLAMLAEFGDTPESCDGQVLEAFGDALSRFPFSRVGREQPAFLTPEQMAKMDAPFPPEPGYEQPPACGIAWPECSGDPTECPENEKRGCGPLGVRLVSREQPAAGDRLTAGEQQQAIEILRHVAKEPCVVPEKPCASLGITHPLQACQPCGAKWLLAARDLRLAPARSPAPAEQGEQP